MRTVAALFLAGAFLCACPVQGQKFSVKDVTIADLKLASYEKDSTAEAVILHDIGKLSGQTIDFKAIVLSIQGRLYQGSIRRVQGLSREG